MRKQLKKIVLIVNNNSVKTSKHVFQSVTQCHFCLGIRNNKKNII